MYCPPVGQPGSVSQSTNAPAACTALPSSPGAPIPICLSYILMNSFARLANISPRVLWSTASALIVLSLLRLYLAATDWQHSPAAKWQTAKKSCTGGSACSTAAVNVSVAAAVTLCVATRESVALYQVAPSR